MGRNASWRKRIIEGGKFLSSFLEFSASIDEKANKVPFDFTIVFSTVLDQLLNIAMFMTP